MSTDSITSAVNPSAWKGMPVAGRDTPFNADDAIARILEWSGSSASKFNSAFLWRNSKGEPGNTDSYRLPVGDIVNGKMTLFPRAVFAAAAILSGAHGGLVGVVSDEEKLQLKRVVSEIYDMLQQEYQDPRTVPPWERGGNEREDVTAAMDVEEDAVGAGVWGPAGLQASVNTSGWTGMPVADPEHGWDSGAARRRLKEWADGDWRQYRKGFLWYDPQAPEQANSYKLPIADVIDDQLTIVPRGVNAVAAVLGGARGGVDIPDADMDSVERVVNRIQERFGQDQADAQTASAAPVFPPSSAFTFDYSNDDKVQPFTITADGRASGLLWMWNKCHAGIGDECVIAPRSATNYAYFHNGQVLTADGKLVKVGKITMGTGHAGPGLRWMPAADHYDNTGTSAVVGRVTETRKGGWFDGMLVSNLPDDKTQELRRSPISGDWRRINGTLELVAALAVNTPGFPIVASLNGEVQSITAAGVLLADGTVANEAVDEFEQAENRRIDELDAQFNQLATRRRSRNWARLDAPAERRRK